MSRPKDDPEYDPQKLRERIQRLERDMGRLQREDLILDSGRLLKVRSPNGTYYSVEVTDVGGLSLVNKGTSL